MNDEVAAEHQADEQPASNQSEQSESPRVSAGAQLAALREERGWSIELVASQLNLAPRQIHALETDNHAALPGMAIVRGFIRAYAKLLRVDAAPILAAVEPAAESANALPERAPLTASFSETAVPFGKRNGPSVPVIVGVVVVLLAILFFVAQRAGWVPAFSPVPALPAAEEGSVTKELPNDAAAAEPVPPEQTFADEISEASPAAAQADAGADANAVVASSPVAESVTPASQVENTVAAEGEKPLVFQVKEDTWVEMRRADDSVFVSRVFKAGTTEAFNVPGPLSLVIGNAVGVTLSLRGQPLDISGNASNVARLNVK